MLRKSLMMFMIAAFALCSTGFAGERLEVNIPDPPPIPDWMKHPPKVELPPPPDIKLNFKNPDHFFFSEKKERWFYYGEDGDPHYVKGHSYEDDGKHYYRDGSKWKKANSRYAKKKGWKVKKSGKKWWKFWK